jgi:hypothetical protein
MCVPLRLGVILDLASGSVLRLRQYVARTVASLGSKYAARRAHVICLSTL